MTERKLDPAINRMMFDGGMNSQTIHAAIGSVASDPDWFNQKGTKRILPLCGTRHTARFRRVYLVDDGEPVTCKKCLAL